MSVELYAVAVILIGICLVAFVLAIDTLDML